MDDRDIEEVVKDKYNYQYDQYQNDIRNLKLMIEPLKQHPNIGNFMIIGVARGGLTPALHLSNILNCKMSYMKFQTRHGDVDKTVSWYNAPETIHASDRYVIIEDIYDSGKTMKAIQKYVKEKGLEKQFSYYTLYGNKKAREDRVTYLHETLGRWIVFPWERI